MSDDLSKLTPTDPSAIDPFWKQRRQDILEDVMSDTSTRGVGVGRWGVGIAAVATIALLIGGTLQQLRSEPQAVPAAPSASVSPIPANTPVAATGVLIDTGQGISLCTGGTTVSRPPECHDGIPVSGITWDDIDWESRAGGTSWAESVLVGTFDQKTFTAETVYFPHSPEAPSRSDIQPEKEFASLCTEPTQGYGAASTSEELHSLAQELPGFQAIWPDNDARFDNIAVVGNVTRAREKLEVSWGGEFCVGTLAGPTDVVMRAADNRLVGKYGEDASVPFFAPTVRNETYTLVIDTLLATPELAKELEQIVGPEVWPFTTVSSRFFPVEEATSPEPVSGDSLVAAGVTLVDRGDGMTFCNGLVLQSLPPGCAQSTDVLGLTWDDVPWAETIGGVTFTGNTIIVGMFDGDAFVATEVFRDDDPEAPQLPTSVVDRELPTLCEAPFQGTGPPSQDALISAAAALPGYQALWISPDQLTWHVAVTEDLEGARATLAEAFGGSLCVGTVPGPTDRSFQDAQKALKPMMSEGVVWSMGHNISERGVRLEITVALDTPEVLTKVRSAVGAEIWPYTDVASFFYPIEGTPPTETVSGPPLATDPSETTTSAFTDEQRAWAEETVAGVLESMGQPNQPDVTALMTKVTYGQYMEVWNIDIPEPPGPPSNDDDVLVVAISGPLDGRVIKGGPPQLTTPDALPSARLQDPIGTVTVLNPDTGESLSHATVVGGESPTDSIMKLPPPVEEVALPDGFR